MVMTGSAMAPTINGGKDGTGGGDVKEQLWIRRLEHVSEESVFNDDVVVVVDPEDDRRKYVRRITAMPGEEMVSKKAEEPPFVIPDNHCWVMCDNLNGKPDSRWFGPLALDKIIGRVLYAARNATDHARVRNSDAAMAIDDAVLAIEEPAIPTA
uniref:Peptidase S26 domain-containing protein n=1 Tax=Erythrolobus madagascarensis TaxID=708628 RepID=A0A7S0T6I0_9RHOD|mmetsp:Transcript_479/g.939  ORF Transcript_479/g.939 Transcript_479/m.939 type:complete len:154 (+) Transcript_479:1-462(+)